MQWMNRMLVIKHQRSYKPKENICHLTAKSLKLNSQRLNF